MISVPIALKIFRFFTKSKSNRSVISGGNKIQILRTITISILQVMVI